MFSHEPSSYSTSFIAAVQASLSVIMLILYGGIAAHLRLLEKSTAQSLSNLGVKLFLPALLFTKIASGLHSSSIHPYIIIFLWAIFCHGFSLLLGRIVNRWLGLPAWTTMVITFNNTTSYPLLLIQTLSQAGLTRRLLGGTESAEHATERAKSYFLVYATLSIWLIFKLGPNLGETNGKAILNVGSQCQRKLVGSRRYQSSDTLACDRTPLLSTPVIVTTSLQQNCDVVNSQYSTRLTEFWSYVKQRCQNVEVYDVSFLAISFGMIVGLIPELHNAFFAPPEHGGIFTVWLTTSLQTLGSLFVPVPVLVAGVILYTSLIEERTAKRRRDGDDDDRRGSKISIYCVLFVIFVRFILWPVLSMSLIGWLTRHTSLLGNDRMLWFVMMLVPTGPPAMKIISMLQLAESGKEEVNKRNPRQGGSSILESSSYSEYPADMSDDSVDISQTRVSIDECQESIAPGNILLGEPPSDGISQITKLIAICYIVSPILSLTVVASLAVSSSN